MKSQLTSLLLLDFHFPLHIIIIIIIIICMLRLKNCSSFAALMLVDIKYRVCAGWLLLLYVKKKVVRRRVNVECAVLLKPTKMLYSLEKFFACVGVFVFSIVFSTVVFILVNIQHSTQKKIHFSRRRAALNMICAITSSRRRRRILSL
jgi:hypothetical protein